MVAGVVAVGVFGGGTSSKPESSTGTATRTTVAVSSVVDGDTLRVRLLAIDTPEVGRNGQGGDWDADEAT